MEKTIQEDDISLAYEFANKFVRWPLVSNLPLRRPSSAAHPRPRALVRSRATPPSAHAFDALHFRNSHCLPPPSPTKSKQPEREGGENASLERRRATSALTHPTACRRSTRSRPAASCSSRPSAHATLESLLTRPPYSPPLPLARSHPIVSAVRYTRRRSSKEGPHHSSTSAIGLRPTNLSG